MFQGNVASPSDVILVEPSELSRQWWSENQPEVQQLDLGQAVAKADGVLLAVKPGIIPKVMDQAKGFWKGKLIVVHRSRFHSGQPMQISRTSSCRACDA